MKTKLFFILVSCLLLLHCSSGPTKRHVGEVIDDAVISNKIKVIYLKDKIVKGFKINIDTWRGVVKLSGKLDTQEQIDRAIILAERQSGVKEVKSYLYLKNETSPQTNYKKTNYTPQSPSVVEEREIEQTPKNN